MSISDPRKVYDESIVIDATCPLASSGNWYESWIKGGVTAIAPTVIYENIDTLRAFERTAEWLRKIQTDERLLLIENASQIRNAKTEKKMGIILAFQNTTPFSTNIDLVKAFYKLGIRITLIAYNQRNFVGNGCEEKNDSGLSNFGSRYVEKCNECGMLLDLSHTGYRTCMDTIEHSKYPVVITHSNPKGVYDSPRNIPDDLIKAVANKNGVIGVNAYPPFMGKSSNPPISLFVEHIKYVVKLVGAEHVGLGLDYYEYMSSVASKESAEQKYQQLISTGSWTEKAYPPPPWHWPNEINLPEKMPNIADELAKAGFEEEEVRNILGGNFLRVFEKVWK